MAKLKLDQQINDFKGELYSPGLSEQALGVLNVCRKVVHDKFGADKEQVFAKTLQEDYNIGGEKTIRDIMMSALMTESDKEKKESDFQLLQQIATGKTADLGKTERQRIYDKIVEKHDNVLVCGRAKEMLIEAFENSDEKGEK